MRGSDHPQRLAPAAGYGTLLKRLTGIVGMRAVESERDEAYLAMIRQLPCLRCGLELSGEAAHLRLPSGAHGKASGIGKKPSDRWTTPLCRSCHFEQHKLGERQFWHGVGVNPFYVCERLYAKRGDLVAMRAVILRAISERG